MAHSERPQAFEALKIPSFGMFVGTFVLTMALLVLHGLAGVFWMTSSQVLLYDIVGVEHLASAVRLNATARYFGVNVFTAPSSCNAGVTIHG